MGDKIGKMAMDMPKYTPLPIPGGSLAGATRAVDIASQIPSKMSEERLKNSELGKLLKLGDQRSVSDMEFIKERLKADKLPSTGADSRDIVQRMMKNG